MPVGELFINGKDAYTEWGLSLEDEGLSRLMTPRPHKQPVTNKNVTANGAFVIQQTTGKVDERTISLPMHITAPNRETFWSLYYAFCSQVLNGGTVTLKSTYMNETFTLTYQDVQNFTEFMQQMCKFDVVFYESNYKELPEEVEEGNEE